MHVRINYCRIDHKSDTHTSIVHPQRFTRAPTRACTHYRRRRNHKHRKKVEEKYLRPVRTMEDVLFGASSPSSSTLNPFHSGYDSRSKSNNTDNTNNTDDYDNDDNDIGGNGERKSGNNHISVSVNTGVRSSTGGTSDQRVLPCLPAGTYIRVHAQPRRYHPEPGPEQSRETKREAGSDAIVVEGKDSTGSRTVEEEGVGVYGFRFDRGYWEARLIDITEDYVVVHKPAGRQTRTHIPYVSALVHADLSTYIHSYIQ